MLPNFLVIVALFIFLYLPYYYYIIVVLIHVYFYSPYLTPHYSQTDYTGSKKQQQQNGYSTWDPRKMKTGEVPQYDEIPYGDVGHIGHEIGHSGKGQLPTVPADYSEVPQVPQRQGTSTKLI